MDAIEDMLVKIFVGIKEPNPEIKKAKDDLFTETHLPQFLERMDNRLKNNGGLYLVGNSLSIADFFMAISSYGHFTNPAN